MFYHIVEDITYHHPLSYYGQLVVAMCDTICEDFDNKQSVSQFDMLRINNDFNMTYLTDIRYIICLVYNIYNL